MKTLAKILGSVVAVLALLLVAAALIVPLVVDPNDHKGDLIALVKEHTGRDLEIGGDLTVSVFPWLSVSASRVRLSNGPGYQSAYMAELGQMSLRMAWWPLIRGRLELDKVTLQGLVINLERRADGRGNWQDLSPEPAQARAEIPPAEGPGPLAVLALGGLDVRDSTLTWYDAVSGQAYTVEELGVTTGALAEGSPVAVKTSFTLVGGPLGTKSSATAEGLVSFSPAFEQVRVEGLAFEADVLGEGLPGGRARVEAGGDLSVKMDERRVTVPDLSVAVSRIGLKKFQAQGKVTAQLDADLAEGRFHLSGVRAVAALDGTSGEGERVVLELITELETDLSGQRLMANNVSLNVSELSLAGLEGKLALSGVLSGDLARGTVVLTQARSSGSLTGEALAGATLAYESTVSASAELAERRLRARELRVRATLEGERVPGNQVPLELAGNLDYEAHQGRLVASDMSFQVAGVDGSGELTASQPAATRVVSGSVRIAEFSPRALLARLDLKLPERPGVPALESARLSMDYRVDEKAVHLTGLDLRVDDAHVEGQIEISDAALPAARFDLRADGLNVDRYRALLADGDAPPPVAAAAADATSGALTMPMARLRAMQLDGRLRAAHLTLGGAKLSTVDASLTATQGVLRLSPVKAALYGGSLDAQVELDARGDSPLMEFQETVSGVRADKLLADLGIDTGKLRLRGGSDWSLRGSLDGEDTGNRFRVHGLELRARLADKAFADGALKLALDGDLDLDLNRETLQAEALKLSVDNATAVGKLTVTQLLSDPRLAATVNADSFDPRRLLRQALQKPVETADPKALASASLSASVLASRSAASVDALTMSVDETKLTGSLAVENFAAPGVRFDIAVDELNLDRYLPPVKERSQAASAGPAAAVALLPVNAIRDLDLEGDVRIARLTVRNVKLQDVRLSARGKDGELRVNPVTAGLYDGHLKGDVYVDARGELPRIQLNEELKGVQAALLLTDLQGSATMSGRTDVSARLTAVGTDSESLKKSVDGDARFSVSDGTIHGMDLLGQICAALAAASVRHFRKEDIVVGLLRLAAPPAAGGDKPTGFSALSGSVKVREGVAHNDDLTLESALLTLQGQGKFDLVRNHLDYKAMAELSKSAEGEFAYCMRELEGIPIPVHITGKPGELETVAQLTGSILQVLEARERARRAPSQPASGKSPGAPPGGETSAGKSEPREQAPARRPPTPEELLQEQLRRLLGQ